MPFPTMLDDFHLTRARKRAAGFLLLAAWLCAAGATSAADAAPRAVSSELDAPVPEHEIDLVHTSWTAREGAPAASRGIAQTPDGWIWIGGKSGLYKFDGVRFLRASGAQAPLGANISALGVLRDGRLWIGYFHGGISLMEGGVLRHFAPAPGGLPPTMVTSAALDARGRLWLGTSGGLYRFDGGWHLAAEALAPARERVHAIALDHRGALWVRSEAGLFSLAPGAQRFERKRDLAGYGTLALHPDGSLWTNALSSDDLLLATSPRQGAALHWRAPGTANLMFDSEGYLWMPTGVGLWRGRAVDTYGGGQHSSVEKGLSGNLVSALFEDREGNVWAGTESGIDRFRKPRLRALPPTQYSLLGGRPIAGGPGGSAWVDRFAVATPDAAMQPYAPASDRAISALHRSADGTLWGGGDGELWSMRGGRRTMIPRPPGLPSNALVLDLVCDLAGTLWVNFGSKGLYTWRGGSWSTPVGIPAAAAAPVLGLAADDRGRVWLGFTDGRIGLVAQGKVSLYGEPRASSVGAVAQILPAGDGAWIGGESGLAYFDGRRLVRIAGKGGEPFTGITGLVSSRDGALWINGSSGISSIAAGELRRALGAPDYQVRFGRLDYRDGLRSVAGSIYPMPSAATSEDGTLWFSTLGGVYAFDPDTLPRNGIAPPVLITGLQSRAASFAALEGARLPAGTDMLRIGFTALSFQAPERMEFLYRLDGVDAAWREGTGERWADYTNLAPGHYRFRVLASNNDGVWNDKEASLGFEIAPRPTQTVWFRTLCALALVAMVAGLYALRTRQLARRYGEKLHERLEERERIARALHDTLLQGMQGLILKFQSVVKGLPREDRTRLGIEAILDQADAVMAEGRAEVMGLRGHAVDGAGLAQDLSVYGASLQEALGPAFSLIETGDRRDMERQVGQEVYAIAREAVFNAYRHAQASRVDVELAWRQDGLWLFVRDDGAGMTADVLEDGSKQEHWGLPGMKERAAFLGGAIDLRNRAEHGLEVVLRVPAARAYA